MGVKSCTGNKGDYLSIYKPNPEPTHNQPQLFLPAQVLENPGSQIYNVQTKKIGEFLPGMQPQMMASGGTPVQ